MQQTAIVPTDPAALSPSQWQARNAALRSRGATDDDPRVVECAAALSFWRLKRTIDREVAAGHMSPSFAEAILTKLRGAGAP